MKTEEIKKRVRQIYIHSQSGNVVDNLTEYIVALLNDATAQQGVQADETTGHPIADAVQDLVHYIESDEA